jgi:predicted esterase
LIFLHGLGDSGSSWASQLLATMRQQLPDTKIVCPTAPTGAVTCNHGAEMTRWHDIQRFEAIDDDAFEKYDGLSDSVDIVRGLVQRELDAGIAPSKIVLGGFSQGGALSLFAGLSLPVTIGGVVSLSGYGVKRNELVNKLLNDKSKQTKVFIGHGTSDNVVKYASGDLIAKLLGSHGVNVQFTGYNVMHFTSAKELRDAKDFIKNCFADE